MSLTVASLKAQEAACVLSTFDSNVAWEIGSIIRTKCQERRVRPAIIYIAHANSSQMLFFATSGPGTLPDSTHWLKRKEATVLRWGMSSLCLRLLLEKPDKHVLESLKDKFEMPDPTVYSCHGGGFPVRVKNVEGIVGVIVVCGMTQEDDHGVVFEGIQEYLAKQ